MLLLLNKSMKGHHFKLTPQPPYFSRKGSTLGDTRRVLFSLRTQINNVCLPYFASSAYMVCAWWKHDFLLIVQLLNSFFLSNIWKLTLAIIFLNCWSKSHTYPVDDYFISLISIIHCHSDLGFLKSPIIAIQISSRVLCASPGGTIQNFINQSSARPKKFITIYTFLMSAL